MSSNPFTGDAPLIAVEASGPATEPTLRIEGEIDVATAPQLRAALTALVDGGARRINLDLAAVRFVDSSGLGVLVGALRKLEDTERRAPPRRERPGRRAQGVRDHGPRPDVRPRPALTVSRPNRRSGTHGRRPSPSWCAPRSAISRSWLGDVGVGLERVGTLLLVRSRLTVGRVLGVGFVTFRVTRLLGRASR